MNIHNLSSVIHLYMAIFNSEALEDRIIKISGNRHFEKGTMIHESEISRVDLVQ